MPQHEYPDDELLTPREAAEVLRTKEGTLAAWRSRRTGPPWIQVSERMPRYKRAALTAWLAERTVGAR